jgi:hypothetical protein
MDSTATFMATKLSPMRRAARTRAPSTSSVAPLPLTVLGRSKAFVPSASRRLLSPFALVHCSMLPGGGVPVHGQYGLSRAFYPYY